MKWWLLGAGGVLLAVACIGAWYAVHSPAFWTALVGMLASLVLPPLLKASPEAIERNRDDTRRRVDRDARGKERMR